MRAISENHKMKLNKRIHLVLFNYEPQFSDGRIVRIKALANYLVANSKNVSLYSLSNVQRSQIKNGFVHFEIKYPGMGLLDTSAVTDQSRNIKAILLRRVLLSMSNWLYPDRYVFSIPKVYSGIRKEVEQGDTIFISVPWFSAMFLALFPYWRKQNVKLILDYRDLWVNNSIFAKGAMQKIFANWVENAALKRCDAVSVTTSAAVEYFEKKGVKAILVSNGISQSDAIEVEAIRDSKYEPFRVGYFGNLGNKRECTLLLKGIVEFGFSLVVYGKLDASHLSSCEQSYCGCVDRRESLLRAAECGFLLIVIRKSENSDYAIPGKVYEYVLLNKPILIYCPHDAIVLDYLKKISYPHFHIESEVEGNLNIKLGEFLEYAKYFDWSVFPKNYEVPIRENEFSKLNDYFNN